ncbi:hypothetical protein BY996DRAFT_4574632 [Phakopsora pachyrhizi]|uniref:Expressed protein n=1 Tax=Phakopsora pachyrhizi TaxID=170000 RepID=A0AAV0BBU0_PHAPC|nr:hypothetical protein BY996DRAFT_4574632 [Phakopsora pachyrhizi]CAH7684813.1 expressed protein [Phakopsora pachyrhizi]
MENPSHGAELSPNPIDLAQIWSSLAKASRSSGIIGNEISLENRPFSILDEEEKKRIEIEFSHLVVEEECAGPSSATTSHSSLSEELYSSSKETCHGDLSSYIFTGNSLLPTDRCPTSVYSTNQSIQSLNDFSNLNDTFKSFINSFEMSSSSQFSVAQPTAPPEAASTLAASNSFLSSTCLGVNSTPEVDQTFQFPIELTSSSVSESLSSHPIDVSIGSISSVPSPASMIHPNAQESIKADFNESTHRDAETKGSPPPSVASNHRCSNMGTNSVSPSVPFGKSNSCATSLTLDVATEVELAIPQLIKLDRLNTYPTEDIKLFLIGLPAEGAKTRVETQIKLTIALVVGQGGSVDREGNLVTDVARSNLARIGNWSYIKLPVYSAIKWKSKKLIKTGIPPEETLYLDVAVMRASEPYDEIYCCSNCQLREQKRTQRKRDARVRPAQEIDSDEADQVVLPEDEKRKIVVFNCGQYVDFHTGEITLPTRITCYCRHHREKKGFRVKVSLRDHKNVLVASSVTPAIMITDDHKAVAAAAKAKSTSDVEDANLKTRPIRKLPAMNTTANQSTSTKLRKKKSSIMSVPSSMALGDLSYDESSGQICSKISINCGLSDKSVESQSPVSSNQQSLTPSIAKSKRKALGEHGLRVSSGKKSASDQASFKLEENALSALPSTTKKACQISVINDYPNSGEFQGSILSLPQYKDPAASENSQILTVTCDSGPIAPITITTPSSLKPGATSRKKRPKDKTTNSLKSSPRRRQADSKTRLKIKPALTIDVDMKDIRLNKRVGDCFLPAQNEQSFQKPISPHNSDYFLVDPIIYQKAIDSSVAEKKTSENFCLKNYEQTDQTQELHQSLSGAELTSSSASSPDRITPNPLVSQNCSSPSTSPNRATDSRRSSRPDNSYSACNSRNISQNQVLGELFRDSSSEDINHTLDISNWPSAPTEKSTEATAPSHACNTSSQLTGQSPMGIMGNVLANWDVLSSFLPSAQSSSCDSSSTTPLRTKEVKSITLSRSNVNNLLIENKGRIETVSKTSARIQKLVPNEGPMEGGVEITILGEGFHPNLKAVFSCGSVVKTEFWSSKALVCILPPSVVSGRCEVSLTSEGEGDYMTQEGQVFTYLNKADQKLMELALQVVGLKMTGQIQDVKIFARKLIKRK